MARKNPNISDTPPKDPNRGEKGLFTKGNKAACLPGEQKTARAALKIEIARAAMILTRPVAEMEDIMLKPPEERTVLEHILITAITDDKFYIVQDYLDRTCGKATQATSISLTQLPDDALKELAKQALAELGDNEE